jgi:hypothetical protein
MLQFWVATHDFQISYACYRESKREVPHGICGVQAIITYDECVVHQSNCKFGIAKLGLGK